MSAEDAALAGFLVRMTAQATLVVLRRGQFGGVNDVGG
jgi:hypothetical protein